MFTTGLRAAGDLLREAVASMRAGEAPDDSALHEALELSRELARWVSQVQVETVAALERSGGFAAAGYKRPESAVANVLTVERRGASVITRAAERVCPRGDLQGQGLPGPPGLGGGLVRGWICGGGCFPPCCRRPRWCSQPGPRPWRMLR